MAKFSEFYNCIDDIITHLKKDFIGPVDENEVIKIEPPLNAYSLGIMHPQDKTKRNSENPNIDTELFEDTIESEEIFSNINNYKPSSLAVSFTVLANDSLNICFSCGQYLHTEKFVEPEDGSKSYIQHLYQRIPKKLKTEILVPESIGDTPVDIPNCSIPIKMYAHVRRIYEDGSKLITISVINDNKATNSIIEDSTLALFQCCLSIKSRQGFLPIYSHKYSNSTDEEISEMLYDSIHNYSYGHGCSTIHKEENCIITEILSEFIPYHKLLQMMPRSLDNSEYLYMKYWENADRKTACNRLLDFIHQYEDWFKILKTKKAFINKYPISAQNSFNNIEICISRLKSGVQCLIENNIAWQSFKYMNEAMLWQRVKTKHCSQDVVSWYPFQMAYVLQIICDIVDEKNPFREEVDLLWFPTGGGKTEAYLGLSAFSIFYRRLSSSSVFEANGVTIIMRYTLRLLTIQQFERATALICACEYMRRKYKIPGDEISIGLWIGSGMTPNHIKDAEETLNKLKEDINARIYEANPMQITKCPWCGSEIGLDGYDIKNGILNIHCAKNPNCEYHNHLPIYVVDDDIYISKPTILLSTVDKFARLTWEERAGGLLGADGNKPPELIIQDELHLISGPLGSITGIYEIAIDEICKHYGVSPKIIASTATVKNANKQIKILYNRKMIQFPPNGLSYNDSFFAVESDMDKRPARTYVGICSISGTSSEILIKIFALLIYLKCLYIKQGKPTEVIDQFYTTVGYFNSLKELGTSAIIIMDRINTEIKYLIMYKFYKEAQRYNITIGNKDSDISSYLKSNELTSRNSAKEIKEVLELLGNKYTSDSCFDYIMASNMLSVGIDIDRLGVMCVYGQPKSNAEYIQATSRVGRTNPGLVITLYNGMRSRDKSYYEQFKYYHTTFYKYVESTSVTSYSPRAIEKALHCILMTIIRHTIPKYNSNQSASEFKLGDKDIEKVKEKILLRVTNVEPRMTDFARDWLDWYLECWDKLVCKLKSKLVYFDYHNEDISLFKNADNNTGSEVPAILNSVRNVEYSSNIYFTKR